MKDNELRQRLERLLSENEVAPVVKVSELKDRILKEKARCARGTLRNYEMVFRRVEAFTDVWFSDGYQVNEFLGQLSGLNDSSVDLVYRTLRAIGRHCNKVYGWPDPTEHAVRPKVTHKRRRYFSHDEVIRIVEACRSIRDKALILCLLDSSCRIGELVHLRDVDLKESSFVVSGKTGQRSYRCDPVVIASLRECCVDGVVFPKLLNGGAVVRPVCFTGEYGLNNRVRRIVVRAGLEGEKLGPHTLRHTVASLVARETKSALAVKAMLQHDSIQTSMIYIHDAEDVIQQGISPLRLAGVKLREDKQLAFEDRPTLLLGPGESDVRAAALKLIEELLPGIPDGVRIRPALDSDDLLLIRSGLIELMRVKNECGSGSSCVQLLRRMMRKVR